ncbi:hypothetical protein LPJ75_001009 [Coemansia sp. RSA 2598]|nr:hypothetical protein LPJ75_001009 [Coemansia sp. RSA 2598]
MSLFNRERVTAALDNLLARHSQGLETTIYADDAMLRIINSAVPDGIAGLLQRNNKVSARNIRQLGEDDRAPGLLGLADGSHILFLLGDVSWLDARTWMAIGGILSNRSVGSCTLCVAVPERLWNESLALASHTGGGPKAPVTEASVCAALRRLGGLRQSECSVYVHGMAAMALPGEYFLLPWDIGSGAQTALARRDEWLGTERAALGLVALVHALGLDARFYSLGSGAARRVARRSAAMPRTAGGQQATVIVLDRAADMAAVVRHGGNVLDDLLRAMESTGASQELRLAKLCQSAAAGDKLARLEDRRKAEALIARQSDSLKQMWDEAQAIGANCRWRETQAAEKTLALVLATENDADAAWDYVLTAIPQLVPEMIPDPASHMGTMSDVSRILAANTPAPGMLVMAASLLAPRRLGFPQTQRELAVRRLVSDYASVAGHSADALGSHMSEPGSDAWRWASWLVDRVAALAEGKDLPGPGVINYTTESSYSPLFPRIAADIAAGRPTLCAQLELAEHGGAATSAASLLKGLG